MKLAIASASTASTACQKLRGHGFHSGLCTPASIVDQVVHNICTLDYILLINRSNARIRACLSILFWILQPMKSFQFCSSRLTTARFSRGLCQPCQSYFRWMLRLLDFSRNDLWSSHMSPVCLVFEFLGGDYHLQEVLFNIYYNNVRVRASVYIEIIWFFFSTSIGMPFCFR